MGHLLYLMFQCDRECDGKFGKFVGTKHTPRCVTVSEFWQHRAQLSSFWRPCRFLLAAVSNTDHGLATIQRICICREPVFLPESLHLG